METTVAFDPTKPVRTRDGKYEAKLFSRRRRGGFVFEIVGLKNENEDTRKFAYREDGRLFIGAVDETQGPQKDHPFDLVNV